MDKDTLKRIEELNYQFEKAPAENVIGYFVEEFGPRIALASSLSLEDQILTDMIVKTGKNTRIFTLDTGRLFPETYQLISRTNSKYGINLEVFFPDFKKVQDMVNVHGINLFYEDIEKRKQCCYVRKLEPLKRAFKGLDAWICGLRREQSVTRNDMKLIEWDDANSLIKINPLIDWSEKDVRNYIAENGVPYNKLHDKGYPSIGCEPCTRAVVQGEDIRAGRWWWESPDKKECGLHARHTSSAS